MASLRQNDGSVFATLKDNQRNVYILWTTQKLLSQAYIWEYCTNLLIFEPHQILGSEDKPQVDFATLEHADVMHRQPTFTNHLHNMTDSAILLHTEWLHDKG